MGNKVPVYLLVFFVVVTVFSCKRADNVGNGLLPDANNSSVFYTDTLTLLTRTIREDSLVTSELTSNILGTCNDPVFGITRSNVFAQYHLPKVNFSFPTPFKFDSAVLYIGFLAKDKTEGLRSYGDITAPQRFTIHEVTDDIDPARYYYSYSNIGYDAKSIGSFNGVMNMDDSISLTLGSTSGKVVPSLRFKLDKDWVTSKIINAPSSAMVTNADFVKYLKGLAIISEGALSSGQGGFAYVNLTNLNNFNVETGAGLVIYYNDSLAVKFNCDKISGASRRVNTYFHDTVQASVPRTYMAYYANPDTCFIQSMGMYKLYIQVPHMFDLARKGRVAIHNAELILTPYPNGVTPAFYAPLNLRLLQPNSVSYKNDFIKDIYYSGNTPLNPFYGGSYNSTTNTYHFNCTRYLQDLFNQYAAGGKPDINRGLFVIIPTDNPVSAGRLILDTRKQNGIQFKVHYTIQN